MNDTITEWDAILDNPHVRIKVTYPTPITFQSGHPGWVAVLQDSRGYDTGVALPVIGWASVQPDTYVEIRASRADEWLNMTPEQRYAWEDKATDMYHEGHRMVGLVADGKGIVVAENLGDVRYEFRGVR